MNLRIADAPGLVAFLHRVLSEMGETVLTVQGLEVVTVEGQLFYVGSEPVTVAGPFETLAALLRSEGRRTHAEFAEPPGREPLWEVFEWGGAYFRIESGSASEPKRFPALDAALRP
jgi:hypothetical protein